MLKLTSRPVTIKSLGSAGEQPRAGGNTKLRTVDSLVLITPATVLNLLGDEFMGRQQPIDLNAQVKYELNQKLDELVAMLESTNREFQEQVNQLQSDHRKRLGPIRQQIHAIRVTIKRLRVPLPWWSVLVCPVYRLLRRWGWDKGCYSPGGGPLLESVGQGPKSGG